MSKWRPATTDDPTAKLEVITLFGEIHLKVGDIDIMMSVKLANELAKLLNNAAAGIAPSVEEYAT